MDIILPPTSELLLGSLAFYGITLGLAVATGWDLRRRGFAAWWVVAALTLFVLPVGLIGWAVLRFSAARSSKSHGST